MIDVIGAAMLVKWGNLDRNGSVSDLYDLLLQTAQPCAFHVFMHIIPKELARRS